MRRLCYSKAKKRIFNVQDLGDPATDREYSLILCKRGDIQSRVVQVQHLVRRRCATINRFDQNLLIVSKYTQGAGLICMSHTVLCERPTLIR